MCFGKKKFIILRIKPARLLKDPLILVLIEPETLQVLLKKKKKKNRFVATVCR